MKKIGWILVILLAIRLVSLNQSLWLDEAISANVARNYSYGEIITKFSPSDFHPPLYYLMLKSWTSIFGNSEVSLRLPSVIFSLITVYVVYLLAGPAAAGLAGFNPLLIYYSQEARMYSMVTMLTTLALYFFIKKKYFWFNVMAFLCLITFYGSVFLLVALATYLLIKKKYRELIISNIGIVLAVMILWPLLQMQIKNSQEMLLVVKNWSLVLGKANLKNLLLIPIKFTSGRISFEPKILYYLIAGSWVMVVFSKMLKKNIYSFLSWMSLLIGTIFSIFTPMMQYFRFVYLVPIMAIIINKDKLLTGGFLIFSLVYLLIPAMWREDWKSLSKDLNNSVYMVSSFGDPIKYYRPTTMIYDLRNMKYESEITVIPYGEEIHGVNHNDILTKDGYKKISITNYREITLEKWEKMGTN